MTGGHIAAGAILRYPNAERKNQRLDNPLRKVAASAGDVKKQVGNTVKVFNVEIGGV